jgi:hypothetical protein
MVDQVNIKVNMAKVNIKVNMAKVRLGLNGTKAVAHGTHRLVHGCNHLVGCLPEECFGVSILHYKQLQQLC